MWTWISSWLKESQKSGAVIGYVRISSETQRENTSIEHQAALIEEFCKRAGYFLVAIYFDVETGRSVEVRNGISAALESLMNSDLCGLIVFSYDRFSRSIEDRAKYKREFRQNRKRLWSCTQDFDLFSRAGALYYSLVAVIDEDECDRIVERGLAGKRQKLARNEWPGFRPCYGWKWHNGDLVRDEEEQRVIRYIRRLYSMRDKRGKRIFTLKKIAERLQEKGILPKSCKPTTKPRRNRIRVLTGRWPLPMISKIIKRERRMDLFATGVKRWEDVCKKDAYADRFSA